MHTALEKDLSWATLMRLPLARPSCRAPRRSSRVSRAICLSRACVHAAGISVEQISNGQIVIQRRVHVHTSDPQCDRGHVYAEAGTQTTVTCTLVKQLVVRQSVLPS